MDFVEDLAEGLEEGFVEAVVEMGEGEATGCGEAEEVPECKAMSLRTMGRSVLLQGF